MLGRQSELGAAASTKAVWWDLRLASLPTHLFFGFFVRLWISHLWKKIGAWNFVCVGLLSGQVFSHFGGHRSRYQGQKTCLPLPRPIWLTYEWYALAASGRQEQHGAAVNDCISWRPNGHRCTLSPLGRQVMAAEGWRRGAMLVWDSELGRTLGGHS